MVGFRKEESLTPNQKVIAGCLSGIVTRFVTQPLDVLKVRTQLQRRLTKGKTLSTYETTKKIFYEEGLVAFWHGHNLGQVINTYYLYVLSYYNYFINIIGKYRNNILVLGYVKLSENNL